MNTEYLNMIYRKMLPGAGVALLFGNCYYTCARGVPAPRERGSCRGDAAAGGREDAAAGGSRGRGGGGRGDAVAGVRGDTAAAGAWIVRGGIAATSRRGSVDARQRRDWNLPRRGAAADRRRRRPGKR